MDKSRGGLGVKCLSTLNRALLFEWDWCFVEEREALWKKVINRSLGWKKGMLYAGSEEGVWSEVLEKKRKFKKGYF